MAIDHSSSGRSEATSARHHRADAGAADDVDLDAALVQRAHRRPGAPEPRAPPPASTRPTAVRLMQARQPRHVALQGRAQVHVVGHRPPRQPGRGAARRSAAPPGAAAPGSRRLRRAPGRCIRNCVLGRRAAPAAAAASASSSSSSLLPAAALRPRRRARRRPSSSTKSWRASSSSRCSAMRRCGLGVVGRARGHAGLAERGLEPWRRRPARRRPWPQLLRPAPSANAARASTPAVIGSSAIVTGRASSERVCARSAGARMIWRVSAIDTCALLASRCVEVGLVQPHQHRVADRDHGGRARLVGVQAHLADDLAARHLAHHALAPSSPVR